MNYKLEICIDSVESAMIAAEAGADRVELCANLFEGGTTPSSSIIEECRKVKGIELMVMVRPRGGDFCYSDTEFFLMKRDIEIIKALGADGVVFGILDKDGNIDIQRTKELVELARPMKVTFHRAFDMSNNIFKALEDVIETGCGRILTSGGEQTAIEGKVNIKDLVEEAGDRIIILAGSGVSEDNIKELVKVAKIKECHFSARALLGSEMIFRNPKINMGGVPGIPEYGLFRASKDRIIEMKENLKSL